MGEIGIPRREFLFDIQFWEVRRIIRGYRRRDTLKHQLLAECAYSAIYAMRDPKGKTVADMFPTLFEEDGEPEESDTISEADKDDLQQLMATINEKAEG